MAKLTRKKLASLDASEIGRMSVKNQLRPMLRQARTLYEKQKKIFEAHPNTYSYALDKMKEYYEDRGFRNISAMTKAQLQGELFRLQDFFQSKGSTLPGARSISIEADRRIFGVNEKTGKPKHRMTYKQSVEFWAIYNEFKNLESESYVRNMGSNTVQKTLGEMIIGHFRSNKGDATYFTAGDFARLKTRVEDRKKEQEWAKDDLDAENKLLSGKWADL